MVFLWVYVCVFPFGLWFSIGFMVFLLVHGFRLGLRLCLSFGFMLFLCSFRFAYTVILKRRGVLRTKGQGGVVAGKSVSHHHRLSAWQKTERRQVYGDTGMMEMEMDWAKAGLRRYGGNGNGRSDGEHIFGRPWGR